MREVLLQVGEPDHSVNRHGTLLAAAAGVPTTASWHGLPARVHLELTDRLLATDARDAVAEAEKCLSLLGSREVWLGLHDVPDEGTDDWTARRRPLYMLLAGRAGRCIVASGAEAARLRRLAPTADVHVAPLPVRSRARSVARAPESVTVLGFVWPGRGHDEVVAAARDVGLTVVCVGRAAPGHDAGGLAVTGWVESVAPYAAAATIPVAPNRRVSASSTICDWWAAGRRPLVPRTAYAEELLRRDPRSVVVYDDLPAALAAALADPGATYLDPAQRPGLDVADAAALRFGR